MVFFAGQFLELILRNTIMPDKYATVFDFLPDRIPTYPLDLLLLPSPSSAVSYPLLLTSVHTPVPFAHAPCPKYFLSLLVEDLQGSV